MIAENVSPAICNAYARDARRQMRSEDQERGVAENEAVTDRKLQRSIQVITGSWTKNTYIFYRQIGK